MLQAAVLRVLVISKISRLSSIGASLCRMASLDRKVCKRLALLIALCLLFSLIPVAGSELEPKDPAGMAGDALEHIFELQTPSLVDAQGQSARKLLQTFSKPDQDDMSAIKQIHDTGQSDVKEAAKMDLEAGASLKRALLADAIRILKEDYQMALKKGQAVNSQRYIKVKRFQLIEEIEGKTHVLHKNDQNVAASHGLMKAVEEELYPQDHQRRAFEASGEMAALQQRAGMLWVKAEADKAAEQGLSKLSGSHFERGLTREQEQIHNVVAALRRAGLFAAIAGTIEGMNLFMLPQFSTIFVPTDSAYQAVKQEDINFQLFQYHIVMQNYAFAQLCRLREGNILYTLLPGYSIIVTEEQSPFKFSLDGVSVIAPDLYVDQSIAVHGIDGIFNCTIYGKKFGGWNVPEAGPPGNVSDKQPPPSVSPPPQGQDPSSLINGSVAGLGDAGQPPVQQNAGTIPIPTSSIGDPNSFPFSSSPLASELASDTDASDNTISAKFGACAAATAFVCVLSILCC